MDDGELLPEADAPLLDDQLCFLFYATSRAFTNAYRPALLELDLTYPQYLVMLVLWERDGLSVGELVSGTLTPLLKRLTAKRLISRTRDARDERLVRITLTVNGRRLRKSASKVSGSLGCRAPVSKQSATMLQREMRSILSILGG
jgi:DNA-binding MarR family transcriptional regulator